jgi:hypothetical protein
MNKLPRLLLIIYFILFSTFPLITFSQGYVIKITRIALKATPQEGDWCAFVNIKTEAMGAIKWFKTSLWNGGETKFEGKNAVLPVNFELKPPVTGVICWVYIALDNDFRKTTTASAETQLRYRFQPWMTNGKEFEVNYSDRVWDFVIYYTYEKLPKNPRATVISEQ